MVKLCKIEAVKNAAVVQNKQRIPYKDKEKGVVFMTGINKKQMIGIFAFCFTAMLSNTTMGIIAYIIGDYVGQGVDALTVQNLLTMPALVGTAYAFCVGALHKRIPAKFLMLCAQGGVLAYGMIFLFLGGKCSIYVLLFAAGLLGIGQGSNNTLLAIALSEACPDPEKRGGLLGICMSVMNVGGVLFTTLGGVLAVKVWNYAYIPFLAVAASMAVQFICLPLGKCEVSDATLAAGQAAKKEKAKLPVIVWLLSAHYFIFFLALYVFGTNVSEYIITTHKLGTSAEAGVASSMVTVGGIFAGMFFGAYSKVLKKLTVPVLMGLSVVGLVIPIVLPNIWAIYACGLLLGVSMMGANPYIMGFLAKVAPGEMYSQAMSVFSGFMNGGMVVAITVLAFLTQMFFGDGTYVPGKFVIGAVFAAFCFVTSFFIYARKED